MEKIIPINEQDIVFKCDASIFIAYKKHFGKDILTVFLPVMSDLLKGADALWENGKDIKPSIVGALIESLYSLEMIDLMSLIWVMAKSADESIKPMENWYADFDDFPIYDVAEQLAPMFLQSVISKKKLASLKKNLMAK